MHHPVHQEEMLPSISSQMNATKVDKDHDFDDVGFCDLPRDIVMLKLSDP